MLLAGGIVSICTRKGKKGGNIALMILFGIGALFGFTFADSFSYLRIWAGWCLICAVLSLISLVKGNKEELM